MKRISAVAVGVILLVALLVIIRPGQDKYANAEFLDKSWNTFEEYMEAAGAHDLPRLSGLSHQLSDTCKDASKVEECYNLMDKVHEIGEKFSRDDFKHIYADRKHAIIFTDYRHEETDIAKALARKAIYITHNNGEDLKILFFTLPDQLAFTYKSGRTVEEVDARLAEMVVDTDQDGLDDEFENCVDMEPDCVKTDPNKRDTDGDGWWDSFEVLFRD